MAKKAKSLTELREEAERRGVSFEAVLREEIKRVTPKRRLEVER